MAKKQVQVRGEFGGNVGGWRPAIMGTLNQTGQSDAEASTVGDDEIATLVELVLDAGARPDDVRVVEIDSNRQETAESLYAEMEKMQLNATERE